MNTSVWRRPGMAPLLAMTFAGFTGYAILLPVAPLWVAHGGAGVDQAGLVNGVMLLCTVLTQFMVPVALRRWGWTKALAAGMVLLGVPPLLHLLSDSLPLVLALSGVRGIGFGIVTVAGSSAAGALVPARQRGSAVGAYGLFVALPNVVLLPLGPWLAETVGFWLVFLIASGSLVGVPLAGRVAAALDRQAPDLAALTRPDPRSSTRRSAYRALARPVLLLLGVTVAGGAVITFAPLMVPDGRIVASALFLMGLPAMLARWGAGGLADRYGAKLFLWPLVLISACSMAGVAWAVADPRQVHEAVFLGAMIALGLGYGALQNLTLVVAFAAVSREHHHLASALWNVGFDLGTALGSVTVGALASTVGFAWAMTAVACGLALLLPIAMVRQRTGVATS